MASQAALVIKNPPASAGEIETRVPSLGQEDPLEEATGTHSSVLAWRILWAEEPSPWDRTESDNWSGLAHTGP